MKETKLKKKIKILHLITKTLSGGAEKVLLDMCKYTNSSNFESIVVSFQKGVLENQFKEIKHIKKINLSDSSYFTFKSLIKLNNIIRKEKVDIIQTHLQQPEFYAFLLKLLNPHIKWIVKKGNVAEFRSKLFWRLANGFILKFASKVIITSNGVKKFTKDMEFVSDKKLKVIYSGINLDKVNKELKKQDHMALKKSLHLKDSDKVIICVGRLVKEKGYPYLIEVMEKLIKEDKNYKLLIVGEGYLRDELSNLIKKQKLRSYIQLLGERKDVIQLLRVADIFCMASIREGIPISLMETMYVGLPLVATNVGGNKELVNHKKNGFLEKQKDVNAIKKRVKQLLSNTKLREIIIKNAKKTIIDNFSIKKNMEKYETTYKDIPK